MLRILDIVQNIAAQALRLVRGVGKLVLGLGESAQQRIARQCTLKCLDDGSTGKYVVLSIRVQYRQMQVAPLGAVCGAVSP